MTEVSKAIKILHLSDLHFGMIDSNVVKNLTDIMHKAQDEDLDLIILTGDLTQRARSYQFLQALDFLKSFSTPVVAVPGNHDIPLYNIFARFFRPLKKYNQFIASHIKDTFENEQLVVCGINTSNRFTIKSGNLPLDEVKKLQMMLKNKNKIKIIAAHHSLHVKKMQKQILPLVSHLHPHFVLYGHDHQSGVYFIDEQQKQLPFFIAAGTSTSKRTRIESNSFNLITIDKNQVKVETFLFGKNQFETAKIQTYNISNGYINEV